MCHFWQFYANMGIPISRTGREHSANLADFYRSFTARASNRLGGAVIRPTICEALMQIARIESALPSAREVREVDGGYLVRPDHRARWVSYHWPASDLCARCDHCGRFFHPERDNDGSGFEYDARWLSEDAARRDLRKMWLINQRRACQPCFDAIAPALADAQAIHHSRLLLRQITKEAHHATAA